MEVRFNKLYEIFNPKILAISQSFSRSSKIPVEDFISDLNLALWEIFKEQQQDGKIYIKEHIEGRLKLRAINVLNSRKGTYAKSNLLLRRFNREESEEDAPTSEIADDYLIEDHVLERCKKKEADKRQLIDFLLESAKIHNDSTMIAVIEEFPRHKSVNALAKALGLQRNTVDRKLQRLARYYNPKVHGDILDYFPEGVRVKREFLTA